MTSLTSLSVFCGAAAGHDPRYLNEAQRLGALLAQAGVTVVFGAGNVGLMGGVASAALENGGKVIGVIPEHLTRIETPHGDLMELHVVGSMHERKRLMFDRSEAACILPGGFGTLDEAFEILTWRQLGLHDRPIVLVNIDGFWDPFVGLVDSIIANGFARPQSRALVTVVEDVGQVLPVLHAELAGGEARTGTDTGRF
ncbi:TIGR00730 family Rossman fold protein [Pararhodospirillum photometricum]|uniref:Cytokinin riboside 5'-monophosphate phosphoribohydrolase n=1 Tax=Pararhodospirillum photometricum DSM 122 TaxID=1150469 RepID=H6SRW2_PARPM|nr:TIGR00730 family Rossman fold protein [Pararhodospirillum photometricum]CCG07641.1 Putative uncharacterized protein [Pararhodospirillum photometricum DSM 122]